MDSLSEYNKLHLDLDLKKPCKYLTLRLLLNAMPVQTTDILQELVRRQPSSCSVWTQCVVCCYFDSHT